MTQIQVPISPGELLDKITILRIKCARIADPAKLANVRLELAALEQCWRGAVTGAAAGQRGPGELVHDALTHGSLTHAELAQEQAALERVNAALWDIEDRIRDHEAAGRFDAAFIELARSVYLHNDERAAIKRRINLRLNSPIVEEKSYRPYR